MYELLAQDFKLGPDAATKRMVDLISQIGAIAQNGSIDWTTGQTTIPNGDTIVNEIRSVIGDGGAGDPATNFVALLNDGFAVPKGAPALDDPAFRVIPWRTLYDPISLQSLTQEDWNWLGITASTDPQQLPAAIAAKFTYQPKYVLDQAHVQSLTASAQYYIAALKQTTVVSAVPVHLLFLPVSKLGQISSSQHPTIIKVPPVSTTPTPTGTSTAALGAPPANNSNPINADVLAFITDMVTCFKNAQVSFDKLPIVNIPTAIRICLDATCAQKLIADLQKVMTASGANIITIVGAIAAEGFAALGSLGALQWVGLAILHFAVYWWIMLQANITPRGVCIVHFLPYVSALSGGLVNGYAQGL